MKMMGMLDSAYLASWVIFYFSQTSILSLEIALVQKVTIAPNSSVLISFLFLQMYSMAGFGWVILFVAIFKNAKTGTGGGILIYFASYYVKYLMPNR